MSEISPDVKFIERMEKYVRDKDRAALAHFRRGLSKPPGTAMEMFPYVARYTRHLSDREADAYFVVASLIGLYPTFSWKSADDGKTNLGSSLSFLRSENDRDSIVRRFTALLNSDREDLPSYLRQIISLLKSKELPMNWHDLLRGIKQWNRLDKKIQREWANGFWGNVPTDEKGEEN